MTTTQTSSQDLPQRDPRRRSHLRCPRRCQLGQRHPPPLPAPRQPSARCIVHRHAQPRGSRRQRRLQRVRIARRRRSASPSTSGTSTPTASSRVRSTVFSTANHRYTTPGTVTVKLRVTDNQGKTSTTSRTLTVHAKPVALLTADRAVPTAGETVTYRATGSYDPDAGRVHPRVPVGPRRQRYVRALHRHRPVRRPWRSRPPVRRRSPCGSSTATTRSPTSPCSSASTGVPPRSSRRRPTRPSSTRPSRSPAPRRPTTARSSSTSGTSTVTAPTRPTRPRPRRPARCSPTLGQVKVGLQVTDDDGAVDQSVATITVNAGTGLRHHSPRASRSPRPASGCSAGPPRSRSPAR